MTISVVVPTLNRSDLLQEALKSVLAQTYQPCEVLVVDDGSKEDIAAAVKEFARANPGLDIQVLRNEQSVGCGAGRNQAAAVAKGDYLAFLDSDDTWVPTKLECQRKAIQERSGGLPALVYTGLNFIYNGNVVRQKLATAEGWIAELVLTANPIGTPSSVLVHRGVFLELGGFDPTLRMLEDWDFYIRASQRCQVISVSAPLTNYLEHSVSMNADTEAVEKGWLVFWDKHQIHDRSSRIRAIHSLKLGHLLLMRGNIQRARRYLLTAQRLDWTLAVAYPAIALSCSRSLYWWAFGAYRRLLVTRYSFEW